MKEAIYLIMILTIVAWKRNMTIQMMMMTVIMMIDQ